MQSLFILPATTSKSRNVLVVIGCLGVFMSLFCDAQAASSGSEEVRIIMKRSLDAGDRNASHLHEYAASKRVDEKQIDVDGSVRSETVKTFEDVVVDGFLIRKLMTKDGKALPASEARKEDERVKRIIASRKNETASDKAKRLAEEEKKRAKAHEFSQEIFSAFDFRLAGEEEIAGRKNWVVEATPVAGYKPKDLKSQIFPHLKGKIWIDQQDLLWTKAQATGVDPFAVGFGIIAKLEQGAQLYFEQIRMPDGVWLLRTSGLRATAHVAIVKRIGIEQVTTLDNFRKVPANVRVMEDSTGN